MQRKNCNNIFNKDKKVVKYLCLKQIPIIGTFRTLTGVCNNLENPLWGSTSIQLRRFLPASYKDGFNAPRGGEHSAEGHCDTGGLCYTEGCEEDPSNFSTDAIYI